MALFDHKYFKVARLLHFTKIKLFAWRIICLICTLNFFYSFCGTKYEYSNVASSGLAYIMNLPGMVGRLFKMVIFLEFVRKLT
jgi:hypothetical protein